MNNCKRLQKKKAVPHSSNYCLSTAWKHLPNYPLKTYYRGYGVLCKPINLMNSD